MIDEALKYLGAGKLADDELRSKTENIMSDIMNRIKPRITYRFFDIGKKPEGFFFSGTGFYISGNSAEKMLKDCFGAVLLACTLGTEFDAMLRTAQIRDMSYAVILDACGSALTENVCDKAESEIKELYPDKFLTDRFSPGYGDVPLYVQSEICSILNAQKTIGITSNKNHLVTPMKSVTAIMGISDSPQPARIRGCRYCILNKNCRYRELGEHCEQYF